MKSLFNNPLKSNLLNNKLFTFINIILTLINIFLVYKANFISDLALRANQSSVGFQVDTRSEEYVSNAFNEIYDNSANAETIQKLKNNEKIGTRAAILKPVDLLEKVGSQFCQGTAKGRHIRIYLRNTLGAVCNNDEVFENFKNQKNGVAMLCAEYFPDSKFAGTLNRTNIQTCEFVDSWVFPNNQNRYKFEYTQ